MTRFRPLRISILSALALALAACGDVGPSSDGTPDAGVEDTDDGGDDDPRDGDPDAGEGDDGDDDPIEAPTVVSVSPVDGATGVGPDAQIVITFSEPMDPDSVAAAWSSTEIPREEVTFAWSDAGDVLTVTPDAPLPVAEGDGVDPDAVPALTIAFEIGAGAADADGDTLGAALASEFSTVRRLTLELEHDASLTDSRLAGGSAAPGGSDVVYAGDTSDNEQVKLAVSFELPELPAGADLEIARFSAEQVSASSNIFNALQDLEAVHVRFAQITSFFNAGSLGSVGIFSSSTVDGARQANVTAAVADDLSDGVAYSQYRLEFPIATDDDNAFDTAQFATDSMQLTITYLVE